MEGRELLEAISSISSLLARRTVSCAPPPPKKITEKTTDDDSNYDTRTKRHTKMIPSH
jgi:hypothetical protein